MRKNVIKVLFGLIGVVLGLSSCGLPDPKFRVVPSDVSLSSTSKPNAAVGQDATITASVNISPLIPAVDKTVVTFSTDYGTLSSNTAKTVGGKASVTLSANAVGTANVTASVDGVSAPIASKAISVNFIIPTKVKLVLKTIGTLTSEESIGGWGLAVKLPPSVSIKTKPGSQEIDPAVFHSSGLSSSAYKVTGSFNQADNTSAVPYLKLSSLIDRSDPEQLIENIIIWGHNVGEVAVVEMDINSGAKTPLDADFLLIDKVVTNTSLTDPAVEAKKLTNMDFDFALIFF